MVIPGLVQNKGSTFNNQGHTLTQNDQRFRPLMYIKSITFGALLGNLMNFVLSLGDKNIHLKQFCTARLSRAYCFKEQHWYSIHTFIIKKVTHF
jgi:hypothetical protein